MRAKIVVGLQFGDEGKGITTDFLCSQHNPGDTMVVRYCGGHQAGHTVHYNGISHVFSSFGSGTLRGFPTYISEHCLVYPNALMTELEVLRNKGVEPTFYIHPMAKLVTPYDIAVGRARETELDHGSTGWGIGATMDRNNKHHYKLFAVDMLHPKMLRQKLDNIRSLYNMSDSHSRDKEADEAADRMVKHAKFLERKLMYYSILRTQKNLIFEGAQGIMLDMDHGVFPNVTYAHTTSRNATEMCDKLRIARQDVEVYYVTRCYQTRHGYGWMSNNDPIELINNGTETNKHNQWQKDFKIGEIDYNLLDYALSVDMNYSSKTTSNLVVTCMDQRPGFIMNWNYQFYSRKYTNPSLLIVKTLKRSNNMKVLIVHNSDEVKDCFVGESEEDILKKLKEF